MRRRGANIMTHMCCAQTASACTGSPTTSTQAQGHAARRHRARTIKRLAFKAVAVATARAWKRQGAQVEVVWPQGLGARLSCSTLLCLHMWHTYTVGLWGAAINCRKVFHVSAWVASSWLLPEPTTLHQLERNRAHCLLARTWRRRRSESLCQRQGVPSRLAPPLGSGAAPIRTTRTPQLGKMQQKALQVALQRTAMHLLPRHWFRPRRF
jgi:hypothetical protein